MHRYFYHTPTATTLRFSACDNVVLKAANATFVAVQGAVVTGLNNRTLAVIGANDWPSFCKADNVMKYASGSSNFACEENSGATALDNVPYNNLLSQSVLNQCSAGKLIFVRGLGGGPFCYSVVTAGGGAVNSVANPLNLIIADETNCQIYAVTYDYNATISLDRCLSCIGTDIINVSSKTCAGPSGTNKVIPCRSFGTSGADLNIFVLSSRAYSSTVAANTIATFITSNNCNRLSWNVDNPGMVTDFTVGPATPAPTCLSCTDNTFIMNYENNLCVPKNKFNFNNCRANQTQKGVRCLGCNEGLINFEANAAHQFCISGIVAADYVGGAAIYNCDTYTLNSVGTLYQCMTCNTGFTTTNGTTCTAVTANTAIAECRTFSNSTTCSACNDAFYLNSSGACIKGKIDQCLQYSYTSQHICTKCTTGYTLWGNRAGSTAGAYVACINYVAIRESFGTTLCSGSENNDSMNLYCFCQSGKIPLIRTAIVNSICLPNYITNCIAYDGTNMNLCTECASDYVTGSTTVRKRDAFIVNTITNTCVARTDAQKIPSCNVYVLNQAQCATCATGYYRDRAMKCIRNPSGQQNCQYPTPSGNCQLCSNNHYANSTGACVPITPATNIVANCYKYNDQQKCTICNRGFLLASDACAALASTSFLDPSGICEFNVLTGYPNNQCTCVGEQYYFNSTTNQCAMLANCNIITSTGSCTQCASGMFFSNNACGAVTTPVVNCDLYSADGTCKTCMPNFGLNSNACVAIVTADSVTNCASYSKGAKCLMCKPGFSTSNGNCTALTNTNTYFATAADANLGLICKAGSQMNPSRNCVSVTTTTSSSTGSKILMNLLFIMTLLFLIK